MSESCSLINIIVERLYQEMKDTTVESLFPWWPFGCSFAVMMKDVPQTDEFRRKLEAKILERFQGTVAELFTEVEITDDTVRLKADPASRPNIKPIIDPSVPRSFV